MPTFDVEPERITVFRIGEDYLFAHYFEREDLFEELREYYNEEAYRFEIPAEKFDAVRDRLAEEYHELVVADELEPYCVVIEKYSEHADILRDSVVHWERRNHHIFLMKDELAVQEAIEAGAKPLEGTDFVIGL